MHYSHTPRAACSQGVLQRDVIQVYWREESYGVRDIHMSTLVALIAWQLHSDATQQRTSKPAQWYVFG